MQKRDILVLRGLIKELFRCGEKAGIHGPRLSPRIPTAEEKTPEKLGFFVTPKPSFWILPTAAPAEGSAWDSR